LLFVKINPFSLIPQTKLFHRVLRRIIELLREIPTRILLKACLTFDIFLPQISLINAEKLFVVFVI